MILPMLAESRHAEKKKTPYWLEPKFDGMRLIIEKKGSKVHSWSRTGKFQDGKLPHIYELLREVPFDFLLDGEIARPGSWREMEHPVSGMTMTLPIPDFGKTMEVMGSGPDQAVYKQETDEGGLIFLAFDCLGAMGKTVLTESYYQRRMLLRAVFQEISDLSVSLGLSESWAVHLVPTWPHGAWKDSTIEDFVIAGLEGGVLKDPDAGYHPGARSPAFIKRKAFKNADVVVMGFKEGAGKFKGVIGAIEFGQYIHGVLHYVGSCSGMDDVVRWDISKHRNKYLGKVMTIKYFGRVGKDKAGFRHPQFVGFRDDKLPEQCIAGQD